MNEIWTYEYHGSTIEVRNEKVTGLYVDGKPLDEQKGIQFSSKLTGKLTSGETVEASIGGFFKLECTLLVDGKVLYPVAMKNVSSTS